MKNLSIFVLVVALSLCTGAVYAAGLFLAPRGVVPLSKAGAHVASGGDLYALDYNPAGLTRLEGLALLFDVAVPLHKTDFTRRSSDGSKTFPTVTGEGFMLPSPTLAVHVPWGGFSWAAGLSADYPLMQNWPETLSDGSSAPQRYAVLNYKGTVVLKFSAAVAYEANDWLSLGLGLRILSGKFVSETVLSTCDGFECQQPENPDYDSKIRTSSGAFITPAVNVGILIAPIKALALGLAFESPYFVSAETETELRLPSAAVYDEVSVEPYPAAGKVSFTLPWVFRSGLAWKPSDFTSFEASFVWEQWSAHQSIKLEVENAVLKNVFGLGDVQFADVDLPRKFRDTWSLRFGGNQSISLGETVDLDLRGGLMFEPSAVENTNLTAMAVDLDKWIISMGMGLKVGDYKFDIVYALVLMLETEVEKSSIQQPTATLPPWKGRTTIGEGLYSSQAHLLGIGFSVAL
ncbi:MAG: outer membrane protein transport protein [Myxococcota bacterium]|nr:outer membrane protein transport protein [Myxococcota bacterium]